MAAALNSAKESTKSKGGRRPGAGRPPSTVKGIAKRLPKEIAELLLSEIGAHAKWIKLSKSDDERIVLDTLKYLSDRAYGKAPQAMELTGSIELGLAEKMTKALERAQKAK